MAGRPRLFSEPVKPALLAALRAQLAEGERLAWAESPEPAAFEPEDKPRGVGKWEALVILGGGYATLSAALMAVRSGRWLWLSIPLALVVLGVAGFFGQRALKARARRAIEGRVYGLTTRRALILDTYPKLAVQALSLDAISDVKILAHHGAFADIGFEQAQGTAQLMFRAIEEPERVRRQLLHVIRDPQGSEQQILAAEAYAQQMQQLMQRSAARR